MSGFRPTSIRTDNNATRRPSDTNGKSPATAMGGFNVGDDEDDDVPPVPRYQPGSGFVKNAYDPIPPANGNSAATGTSSASNPAAANDKTPKEITSAGLWGMKRIAKRPNTEDTADPTVAQRPKPSRRRQPINFRGLDFTTSKKWNDKLKAPTAPDPPFRAFKLQLQTLLSNIDKYYNTKDAEVKSRTLAAIRDGLAKIPVGHRVTKVAIDAANFMDADGLPRLFAKYDTKKFPPDVVDDCAALYHRWNQGNLDSNLMRGIRRHKHSDEVKEGTRHTWALDPSYEFNLKQGARTGENDLFVGQWWPGQMAAFRDSAHNSPQAGITGNQTWGAASIVVSGGAYENDVDMGDELWYCGTPQSNDDDLAKDKVTAATELMDIALQLNSKVRVLRSARKANGSKYAPSEGVRYDGLYVIDDRELVEPTRLLYRYHLTRVASQSPIRFEGPTERPTKAEKDAWRDIVQIAKIHS